MLDRLQDMHVSVDSSLRGKYVFEMLASLVNYVKRYDIQLDIQNTIA